MEYPLQAIVDTIVLEGYRTGDFGPTMAEAEELTTKLLEGPLSDSRVVLELLRKVKT